MIYSYFQQILVLKSKFSFSVTKQCLQKIKINNLLNLTTLFHYIYLDYVKNYFTYIDIHFASLIIMNHYVNTI